MRFLLLSIFFISSLFVNGQEIAHDHSILHSFIENKGQWHEQVLFQSKFDGGNMWVQQKKMVFHLQDFSGMHEVHANFKEVKNPKQNRQTVVHLNFIGANEVSNIEKQGETPNYYNYFLGNDKNKWASEVRGYSEAIMYDLYDGIDLKLIEELEQLKYEFHVQPNVDPNAILVEYAGHENISIDKNGNLVVATALGKIIEEKPYAYQIVNGNVREVACEFVLDKNQVKFKLGEYNPHVKLIIDPVLIFATYAGSITDNFGMTATYGYDKTAFSGGTIYGNAYPTPDNSAYDVTSNFTVVNGPVYGVTDVFISHYSADGTTMLWTSFIGGGDQTQGTETVHSLICDSDNNIYLFGTTSSLDFPIQNGYQSAHAGGTDLANFYQNGVYYKTAGTDIYVAKISANGQNLMGSTYFGGSLNDGVNYKSNMPVNAQNGTYYVASQYDSLTSNYGDQFRGEIMLDKNGNCMVATCTKSTDFPTLNAFQPANAGKQDGVIFKLSSDLSTLQWSSYFGGSENDACYSVKIDSSDNVLFAGGTCSSDLSNMTSGWQPTYNGGSTDGFVMKLSPDGLNITNGSYIGTPNYDQAYFVEIDRANNVYLLGQSLGGAFPIFNAGFVNPNSSQFVMKLDSNLAVLINSTQFGNGTSTSTNISPSAFLVDICGNIYISGWGANILQGAVLLNGMAVTPDAFQITPPNGFDFYLLVIEREFADILYGTYLGGASAGEHVDGGTSRFDKNGVVYQSVCGGCGGFSDFPTYPNPGAWSNTNLSTNCNNILFKFDFELIPNAEFTVDDNIGCAPFTVTFDNFSTDSDSYLWDLGNGDTTSIIFEPTVTFNTPGVYEIFLYVTDSICLITDTAQLTITVYDSLELSTIPDQQLCVPTPIDFIAYTNGIADNYIWSEDLTFTVPLNADQTDSVFTFTPSQPGMYYVQVSNAGCSLIDSVYVDYIGASLSLTGNDSICRGETTIITASNSNPLLTFTYVWSPDSIIVTPTTSNSVEVDPNISQYLYVTATSNNGCVISDSVRIYVDDVPGGTLSATASDYLVASGSEVTLTANPGGYDYYWFPFTGLGSPNSQITTATVEQTTNFTVFITNGACTKSTQVLVKTYVYECGEPYVFVPNAFSPNGDGENDVLYVEGPFEEMIFRIYDRWGELVFESHERSFGWDGRYKGKYLDPDVYDYYLDVKCINDEEAIVKGNITLLR
jgi:gliding motility-associated-like protein